MRFFALILAMLFLQLALLPGEMCAVPRAIESETCSAACGSPCHSFPSSDDATPEDSCHCNPLQACGSCALPIPAPATTWVAPLQDAEEKKAVHRVEPPKDFSRDFWQPPRLV